MKWIKAIGIVFAASVSAPFIQTVMDIFTDPVTGLMVVDGNVPDYVITFFRFLPWAVVPASVLWALHIAFKPEEPKQPRIIE